MIMITNQVDTQLMNINSSIMVSRSFKPTSSTLMRAFIEGFRFESTTITAFYCCAFWIYCYTISTSIFRFVLQHKNKCTPRGIRNMFLKIIFIIFNHLFNFQIFISNKVKSIYQPIRKFMLKMISLSCNFSMKIGKLFFNFFTFPFRVFALNFFKFIFRLFQIFWIGNFFSIGKYCKISKSQINPNYISNNFLFWNRIRKFTRENNIPLIAFSLNCASFYFTIQRNLPVKFNFYRSYFRKFNFFIYNVITILWISKTIISIKTFITRKSCFFSFLFYSAK